MASEKKNLETLCSFLITSYPFVSATILLNYTNEKTRNYKKDLPTHYWILLSYVVSCFLCGLFLKLQIKPKLTCVTFILTTILHAGVIYYMINRFRYSFGSKLRICARNYGILASFVAFFAMMKMSHRLKELATYMLALYSCLCGALLFLDPLYSNFSKKVKYYFTINLFILPAIFTAFVITSSVVQLVTKKNRQAAAWHLAGCLCYCSMLPEFWVMIRGYRQEPDFWFGLKSAVDSFIPLVGLLLVNQWNVQTKKND